MKRILVSLVVLLSLAGVGRSQARREIEFTRDNPQFLGAFKGAVARPSASTVRIFSQHKEIALGVVVAADGLILTKANDLQTPVTVSFRGGRSYDAEIIAIHAVHDLALLKIEAKGLIPIEFKDSKAAEVGTWLACVGIYEEPVAIGVVSVATRNLAIKGPIIAIDRMPYLGVSLEPGKGGVRVLEVKSGTPAEAAGLKVSDLIIAVGGAKVDTPDNFMQVLGKNKPGDTVTFSIQRGEAKFDQAAKLAKRPADPSRSSKQNSMGSELSSRRTGYPTILQHDSVVRPIDCGGPIVDLEGRVIGLNICRAGRVESWAVPSEVIRPILAEMLAGKHAPKVSELAPMPMLSPDEKLAQAKALVAKAEKKAGLEKELEEARQALKSAEADAKKFRQKDSAEAADRLLRIMQKRLKVMNEVAGWKWNHRVEIVDAAREKESLAKIAARAKELGIDPAAAERFFIAQFEASRLLQQDAIAAWVKQDVQAPFHADLAKTLRPQIDQINEELLLTLGQVLRYWPDADLAIADRVRRQSPGTLAGISDAVRNKALEGLK